MALLQISEPGASPVPHQRRLAVGIDLGTTHSLVATVRSGSAEVLADEAGRRLLPSVVRFGVAQTLVGHEALAHDAGDAIASAKRLMGKGVADLEHDWLAQRYRFETGDDRLPAFVTDAGPKTAIEVAAVILERLKMQAEASLGGRLVGAVITVPAYFDDAQRQATKDAAALAGLHVLRLINEPTAAAVAYGLDRDAGGAEDRVVAIYDFGGGTFDISLLRLQGGVFEVLATAGDTALGGDDIDNAIVDWMCHEAEVDTLDGVARGEAKRVARAAKEHLSSSDRAELDWTPPGQDRWRGELDAERFAAILEPILERTLAPCRQVLRDATVAKRDLAAVVMVGGSTRIPRVRERIGEFFGQAVLTDIDPDEVVAVGAALQADVLAGNKPDSDLLLLDVIPLSLGLETLGGLAERIVPRNTTIPIARAQEFTTHKDGQTAIALHVVQGERELVSDCRSLARFELRDIPPRVAGSARVQVLFQVDADGLLTVSALEKESGSIASVEVRPSYGLSDGEIENMLRASMEHADDDRRRRAIAEQNVAAERALEALNSALAADGEVHLDVDERTEIEELAAALREAMSGDDSESTRHAVAALEAGSAEFVQRRMDASVRNLMAGRRLDELADTDTH